ncbi:hypothetical protein Tco_0051175 [Tanacetum coccineum]
MDGVICTSNDTTPIKFDENIEINHDTPDITYGISNPSGYGVCMSGRYQLAKVEIARTSSNSQAGPCCKRNQLNGVTCEDEAKRRNSRAKMKTFEENCYLLPYAVSSKEDTAYLRQLITRIRIQTPPDKAPICSIRNQQYDDPKQEKTRNRFCLSVLIEFDTQNYQDPNVRNAVSILPHLLLFHGTKDLSIQPDARMWNVHAATSRYLSINLIVSDAKGDLMHCTARAVQHRSLFYVVERRGDLLHEELYCFQLVEIDALEPTNDRYLIDMLYSSSTSSTLIIDDEKIILLKRMKTDNSGVGLTKEILPADNAVPKVGTLKNLLMWARNRKYDSPTFLCEVMIDKVRTKKGWNYPSCGGEKCKKGTLDHKERSFLYDSCNNSVEYPVMRYRLELEISNDTAEVVVVMFDEMVTSLSGCSASCILDSKELDEEDHLGLPTALANIKVVTAEGGEGREGGASSSTFVANEASKASVLKRVSKTPQVATPSKPVWICYAREGVEYSDAEGSFVADSLPKRGDVACSSDTRKRKSAPTYQCRGCNATMWYEERNNKGNMAANPTFSLCCQQDKVLLPRFNETLKPLNILLDYRSTIRLTWQNEIKNKLGAFIEQETDEGADGTIVGSLIEMLDQNSRPMYMMQNYQDAMALCCVYGNPDLFITFTSNPKWPKINEMLAYVPGQRAHDRPEVGTRVFKLKLTELLDDLIKNQVFRETREDDIIFAELPSPTDDPMGYKAVTDYMLHGPCGKDARSVACNVEDKCLKHFPKACCEETIIDQDGYLIYRRRDNKVTVKKGKFTFDNKYVFPHNRYLLLKYQAHINVKWCNRSKAIKYLFKYLNKGPDIAIIVIQENVANGHGVTPEKVAVVDEIKKYLNYRYLAPCEAIWRILSFDIHYSYPSVMKLNFHLPDQQPITLCELECLPALLEREGINVTMFTDWFHLNERHPPDKTLTYAETLQHYVWHEQSKMWKPRKQRKCISRIVYSTPAAGERYFLQMLLNVVRGPQSFKELLTVNKRVCIAFNEACFYYGLLNDDQEWT